MDDEALPFRQGSDTAALIRFLSEIPVGDLVTYERLTTEIGRDIHRFWHVLESARKRLVIDKGIVFDVVLMVGIRRLNDDEIVDLSDRARAKTRRHARRVARKLICVDYDNLSREKQTKHNASLSLFAAMTELVSSGGQKRLEAKVEQQGTQLPAAKAAIAALGLALKWEKQQ